jgi:hypothetical protein
VGVANPSGWALTLQNQGVDDALDSDADPLTGLTVAISLSAGENDDTWDFGFVADATLLAVIGRVEAVARDGQVVVRWETHDAWNTAGFWLERQNADGTWIRVSQSLIPARLFEPSPVAYEQIDVGAVVGRTYVYQIVELENGGTQYVYGPYELAAGARPPAPTAWDAGAQDLGNGWRRLAGFGDYAPMGEGWVWHNRHGFLYVAPESTPTGTWLYALDMGWLWTVQTIQPHWYRAADASWLFYNGDAEPRWFYNLTVGAWEAWE